MAKWRHRLDIKDIWERASEREITAQEAARLIAERCKSRFDYENDEDLGNVIDEFEGLATDPDADFNDFDIVMSCFYDWGDELVGGTNFFNAEKRCWIATF